MTYKGLYTLKQHFRKKSIGLFFTETISHRRDTGKTARYWLNRHAHSIIYKRQPFHTDAFIIEIPTSRSWIFNRASLLPLEGPLRCVLMLLSVLTPPRMLLVMLNGRPNRHLRLNVPHLWGSQNIEHPFRALILSDLELECVTFVAPESPHAKIVFFCVQINAVAHSRSFPNLLPICAIRKSWASLGLLIS